MEKLFLLSCLAILFLSVSGQGDEDEAITVGFTDASPRMVQAGVAMNFTCHLNQNMNFIMMGKVYFIRVTTAWNGTDWVEKKETLFENLNRMEAEPEYYDATYNIVPGGGIDFHLHVKEVRFDDDGKLQCEAKKHDVHQDIDELSLTVYKPLESVSLKFAGYDPVMADSAEPYAVDAGTYPVVCMAKGSNPGTENMKAFLRGEQLENAAPVVTRMKDKEDRQFESMISGEVVITAAHDGQFVECMAQAPGPAGNSITVKIPIKVNVYDPKITCEDSESYPGKRYITMTCLVDHTDISVDGFFYRIGNTGAKIRDGEIKQVQGHDIKVTKKMKGQQMSELQLELYETASWHFDSDFVLVVESAGGHVTEQRVVFTEIAGSDRGSGAMMTASVITVLSALLLAVYQVL